MTILVAGFAAFPGAPENPSAALALSLDGAVAGGRRIVGAVLPVEWAQTWARLAETLALRQPRAVLLVGLHARAERLRIELCAANRRDVDRCDAAGRRPDASQVMPGAARRIAVGLPLRRVVAALRAEGIAFDLSRDAGGYLCNDTLYRLCDHARRTGLAHYGFIHTPATDEAIAAFEAAGLRPPGARTLPAETLRRAVLATAGAIAEGLP